VAHLREHSNSKFWYVRFRDLDTGDWREESTRLLRGDTKQTRAAQRIADKKTMDESRVGRVQGAFRDWVRQYITDHYTTESTRRRCLHAWERLAEWLNLKGIRHPREIRHEHAREYLNWRKPDASVNTALYELHFLAFIINEAIRREFAERNVMLRLGIGRQPAKLKPELTDEQINAARAAFSAQNRAPWMRISCEIQLYLGCRISETSIPLADIRFMRQDITITDAKRKATDPKKRYTVPLDPALVPTLLCITGERTVPVITREMESRYNAVLNETIGTTSHSFRVTFISRLWESGVDERDAMNLVNHSRKEVHAIYARTDTDRLRPARSRLVLPAPPEIR
jgi:site-specific recombinase XerD